MNLFVRSASWLKTITFITAMILLLRSEGNCQSRSRFGYVVKFSMQGYNLPFKKLLDNFKNPGASLGIEYSYNQHHSVVQTFNIGWFNHAEHGNSLAISSQAFFRPKFGRLRPGLGVGLARMFYFNNSNPLMERVGGRWMPSNRQSESRWASPVSLEMGHALQVSSVLVVTPFVGYDIVPSFNYNNAFPILPSTLLTIGSRINLTKN